MWHRLLGFDLFETIGLLRLHRRNVRLGLWLGFRLVLVLAFREVVLLGVTLETFQLRIECRQRVARHQVHHGIDGLVEVGHGEVGLAAGGLHFALHRLALRLGTLVRAPAWLPVRPLYTTATPRCLSGIPATAASSAPSAKIC